MNAETLIKKYRKDRKKRGDKTAIDALYRRLVLKMTNDLRNGHTVNQVIAEMNHLLVNLEEAENSFSSDDFKAFLSREIPYLKEKFERI